MQWNEVRVRSDMPLGRTGHSCDIIGHYMVIFGGFYKLANELNDLHIFDFEERRWLTLYEQPTSVGYQALYQDLNSYRAIEGGDSNYLNHNMNIQEGQNSARRISDKKFMMSNSQQNMRCSQSQVVSARKRFGLNKGVT